MRRLVVVDASGTIVATAPLPAVEPSVPGAPVFVGFAPGDGQEVHELDLPQELSSEEGLRKLHSSYRVEMDGGEPHVVAK